MTLSNLHFTLPPEALDALAQRVAEILDARREDDGDRDRWLTTREAAEHLGLSVSKVHKLTAAKRIPFSQDCKGGACRFRRRDLDAWMENSGA